MSVGDGERGTTLPELGDLITDGRVYVHVCVCVGGGVDTHTRCTSLS